jgi:fructoselysine 6-kinase
MHTDLFGNVLGWLEEIHNAGVKIVMDFSVFIEDPDYACHTLFPNIDYVFFSNDEADEAYLRDLLKKIKAYGPSVVTVTRGEKGSLSYDGFSFYSYGIFAVKPVNTVGAGDAYIAGFTYGLLNNKNIFQCMEQGARLSSQIITKFEPY